MAWLLGLFPLRSDGRRAALIDPVAYEADLEARLADRRAKRPQHSKSARKGWATRRAV